MQCCQALTAVLGAATIAAFAAGSRAQPIQPPSPSRPSVAQPYRPVAVKITPLPNDAGFLAFRQQLASAARKRVYADLARLVALRGFFVEGSDYNPRSPGPEMLAAAIRLEDGGGAGWDALGGFAAVGSGSPLPSRPGVICAPAVPDYDLVDFDQLLAATGTESQAWRYPRDALVPLRPQPRPAGHALETLGISLIRVLEISVPAAPGWSMVAAPSGRVGFVPAAVLLPLRGDKLCFHKDVTGRWQIAGFVAAR